MFEPGDIVTISYTGYRIDAEVLVVHGSWVHVEQITDYEDHPRGERPRFEAAIEYCVKQGEQPVPGPFSGAALLSHLEREGTKRERT